MCTCWCRATWDQGQDSIHSAQSLTKGRCLLNSCWCEWSGIASSRVSWAAPQGGGHDPCCSHAGHPEAQPLPDGAVPLFPAMPLHEPEERPQDGGSEVTWAAHCFLHPVFTGFWFCLAPLQATKWWGIKQSTHRWQGTSRNAHASESSIALSPPCEPGWNLIHFWVPRAKGGPRHSQCCQVDLCCVTSAGIITEDFEWSWNPNALSLARFARRD